MEPTQEKNHFETFGYVVKRGLFGRKEMESFSRWFDEGFEAKCGPWDGSGFSQMYMPGIGLHEGFCDHYLADPRLLDTLENVMGEGFLMLSSDAQRLAETPWHRDIVEKPMEPEASYEFLILKVVMYLDDLSEGGGCLRIMPGSHHKGWREALQDVLRDRDEPIWFDGVTAAGVRPSEIPGAVPTQTRPGDIIFFNERCFHSSWGGRLGRRYLGMSFCQKPTRHWHVERIIDDCEQHEKRFSATQYSEALLKTENPRLRKLIDFVLDKGSSQSA